MYSVYIAYLIREIGLALYDVLDAELILMELKESQYSKNSWIPPFRVKRGLYWANYYTDALLEES